VRLADLPEFLEEQAEWARLDPPVQLYPNSRFGIGVLSYFMLADELTVETCRMGRDGQAGERLRVSIAGPGSLFRIQDLGPGTETGTTVRLHLREGLTVSSVEELGKLLWVAEFATEATDGVANLHWVPGELSRAVSSVDDEDDEEAGDKVTMTTLHGSKGLEWPIVSLVGLEEELLPHIRTLQPQVTDVIDPDHATDISEERRLCYVGITRAQRKLYMTRACTRVQRGRQIQRTPSRFLLEIPDELLEVIDIAEIARQQVPADEVKNFFSSFSFDE